MGQGLCDHTDCNKEKNIYNSFSIILFFLISWRRFYDNGKVCHFYRKTFLCNPLKLGFNFVGFESLQRFYHLPFGDAWCRCTPKTSYTTWSWGAPMTNIKSKLTTLKYANETFHSLSIRGDYKIEEKELIKTFVDEAEQNDLRLVPNL